MKDNTLIKFTQIAYLGKIFEKFRLFTGEMETKRMPRYWVAYA